MKPSNIEALLSKSRELFIETKNVNLKDNSNFIENIFIVGMFRSGSTLIESILGIN